MARCLVTGHRGYIGSKLYKKLKDLGHEVIGIDLQDGKDINAVHGLVETKDGMFTPPWDSFKPEYIFHMAAIPRIMHCIEEPVRTMSNNVLAGSHVLNYARKIGAKRVIYSSYSSVIGNGAGPTNPYALQKYTTELETKMYSEIYGIDTVSLRYFNVYSECQAADNPYVTVLANWMNFIRNNKNPFITGDGNQRRDMVHVDDVISANIFAMNHEDRFNGSVYDIGTGDNISLNEIKEIVYKYFPGTKFVYKQDRPNEVSVTKANPNKIHKLGWTPEIKIIEGINRCFSSLREEMGQI